MLCSELAVPLAPTCESVADAERCRLRGVDAAPSARAPRA
jgi:hypothetical protein